MTNFNYIENAAILTYTNIKKNNDIQPSVPLYSKTIVPYMFPCFEGPYCSEHNDVVLQINNFTVKYDGPITFSTFFNTKTSFSTPNIIWKILYIEKLVVHLSSLHLQLYKDIKFVEIWQKCYQLHSFDCETV